VSYRCSGEELLIEVADNGPGMSEEQLASVFDPAAAGGRDSSHLGMACSKMIIDKYGGRIEYRSAPGKGTTCLIRLLGRGGSRGNTGNLPRCCPDVRTNQGDMKARASLAGASFYRRWHTIGTHLNEAGLA
jgi:hypothetical protein